LGKRSFGWTMLSLGLMICWPCIIVYQYSETNVMHFLFSLLRIKGLYMFRALLAHPQEALYKRHLVYCMRVVSVGCTRTEVPLHGTGYIAYMLCQLAATRIGGELQSWCSQLTTCTQYTKSRLCSASWGWASNARNMQRPLILNKLNKECITLVSLYWYTMMHGQQNIKL
jgi:hypothetical protein